ncbi:hypothetical protein MKW98_019713 [Papaver atlanticum]|uniref:Uncharacterized protein n=1 Tax=Papaver atlanticum TaxID=357466 RepID=A0AAD4XVG7_9MAGN|nr:hypothetical protein MKW98_019713 [Papaver atlanticum]
MRSSAIADDVRVLPSPGNKKKSIRKFMRAVTNLLKSLIIGLLGRWEAVEVKLKSALNSTSLKSAEQVNIDIYGKCCPNKEDARSVFECQSGDCGFYIGDKWHHHPQCLSNESRERFVLVLLMMSSFLLSFATAGAFYFTQALAIVGSHDPLLKDSLAALNRVVSASFFCNFLGLFVLLILQSRREYHQYKKLSLTISNTASFLFLVIGYGFIIAFNIQRR